MLAKVAGSPRAAVLAVVIGAVLCAPALCFQAGFVPHAPSSVFRQIGQRKGLATTALLRPTGLRQGGTRGMRAHLDPSSVQHATDLLQVNLRAFQSYQCHIFLEQILQVRMLPREARLKGRACFVPIRIV